MAIETWYPDSSSKKDLLPWLMVVVSAGSLQLSAPQWLPQLLPHPEQNPSGDSPYAMTDGNGLKGLAISGQYETTQMGHFSFRVMLGFPLFGPAMQLDFSFVQSWCLLSSRCVYYKIPSHKTSIIKHSLRITSGEPTCVRDFYEVSRRQWWI